jgi:hypothetical protein
MQLQVLGPVQAQHNGTTVALGGPGQRAVLAVLVVLASQAGLRVYTLDASELISIGQSRVVPDLTAEE